ncbi:MAG: hypothetical protein KAH99_00795, partial [Verrucomicrobia bacterium]|nr:hypothetical protein [Verrucomicrobiota bacterium]
MDGVHSLPGRGGTRPCSIDEPAHSAGSTTYSSESSESETSAVHYVVASERLLAYRVAPLLQSLAGTRPSRTT